jgi:hypothetical protein
MMTVDGNIATHQHHTRVWMPVYKACGSCSTRAQESETMDVELEPAGERNVCVRGGEEGRQTVWKRERGVMRGSNASVVERTSWKGVEAGVMKSVVHLSEVFSCPGSIDVQIECRMEEECAG